jgi:peptide-methionine (S)-S-oxide reductase
MVNSIFSGTKLRGVHPIPMNRLILAVLFVLPMLASCEPEKKAMPHPATPASEIPADAETATLAGGCYWCLEAAYRQLDGVYSATSGFMGGVEKNPSYEEVCSGSTGHAEVVQVVFNPKKITYEKLLAWFWDLHDPTTLNRQGNDIGTQYRSAIFYHSDAQKNIAATSKAAASKNVKDPIVTEITKATEFYTAPEFHQDYYFQNKSKNPYCRFVIEPKLKKLKLDH